MLLQCGTTSYTFLAWDTSHKRPRKHCSGFGTELSMVRGPDCRRILSTCSRPGYFAYNQRLEYKHNKRLAEAMRGLRWSLWRGFGGALGTLANSFIYPCSHLSHAGTEQQHFFWRDAAVHFSKFLALRVKWTSHLLPRTTPARCCCRDGCFHVGGALSIISRDPSM